MLVLEKNSRSKFVSRNASFFTLRTKGVKPVGLMLEDFDANGNVRSSMPVQFLATVWTPSNVRSHSAPIWFPEEDDHDDKFNGRRRRSIPSYCSSAPTLIFPTPAAGLVLDVPTGGITIDISATPGSGGIDKFQFSSPLGMTCSAMTINSNNDAEASCNFTPTTSQRGQA